MVMGAVTSESPTRNRSKHRARVSCVPSQHHIHRECVVACLGNTACPISRPVSVPAHTSCLFTSSSLLNTCLLRGCVAIGVWVPLSPLTPPSSLCPFPHSCLPHQLATVASVARRGLATAARPFKILGLQQIAIGGASKSDLASLWVDVFGCTKTGTFRSERENVDEDILTLGKGPYAVEVDLMQPINPEKVRKCPWVFASAATHHVGCGVCTLRRAPRDACCVVFMGGGGDGVVVWWYAGVVVWWCVRAPLCSCRVCRDRRGYGWERLRDCYAVRCTQQCVRVVGCEVHAVCGVWGHRVCV